MSSAQVIEQCTERALPGEPITITADGISSGTVQAKVGLVGSNGQVSSWSTCAVIGQTANVLQVQVPASMAKGVWAVEVTTPKGTSAPVYVNRAEVYFLDSTQSSPGGTLNVYGRNLEVLGTSTVGSVEFVPTSGPALMGTITKASPFNYTVTVPSNAVAGMTYTVNVTNGYGGGIGYVAAPTTLPMAAAGPDPFNLGTWWGKNFKFSGNVYNIQNDPRLSAHCTGKGTVDDTTTIQSAMMTAWTAGGGVIYFPAGTYRVSGTKTLNLLANTVLEGAGQASTNLVYGSVFTPTNAPTTQWCIQAQARTLCGICNMTIQNQSTSATETYGIDLGSWGTGTCDRCFISNCDLLLGNDIGLHSWGSTNIAIENNRIQCLSVNYSALDARGDEYLTYANNLLVFRNARLNFPHTSHVMITGNTFSRDNTYMTANCVETGALELSGAQDVFCANNIIQGVGPFPVRQGCGELINMQFGGDRDYQDVGHVSSATSNTLTNSSANWPVGFTPTNQYMFNPAVVRIVSGTGMGQTRTVASNTATTLTLTQAWTVTPDSTSEYSIGTWPADHLLLLNNTLSNSNVGILFWNGALDSVADNNTLNNCGTIMLRSMDGGSLSGSAGTGNHEHDLCWGDWISNNTVNDTTKNVAASIVVYTCNALGQLNGNGILDAEVRSNTINAHAPNYNLFMEWGASENFYATIVTYNNGPKTSLNNIASRFLNNKTTNIASPFSFSYVGLTQIVNGAQISP